MSRDYACPKGHRWQQPRLSVTPPVCPHCGNEPSLPTTLCGSSKLLSSPAEPEKKLPTVTGYDVLHPLGSGGVAVVYLAWHLALEKYVAIKILRSGVSATERELVRFRREAEITSRLQHPNIVQVYEVGEANGLPYLSLEFVEGGTLTDRLDGTPWEPARAAGFMAILARAVHAAHEQDVIHRDLKPSNVLLTEDGVPKLADFGLGKFLSSADQATRMGAILGTASYMSPEQASGKTKDAGPTADIYSLGSILYELLTGRVPFKGKTPMDTIYRVVRQAPTPPSQLQPRIPPDLELLCLKCLEKDPNLRYASALALADDLCQFVG